MERLEVLEFNNKEIDEATFEKIIESDLIEHVDGDYMGRKGKNFIRWKLYIKNSPSIEVLVPFKFVDMPCITRDEKLESNKYIRKIRRELKDKEDELNEQFKNI